MKNLIKKTTRILLLLIMLFTIGLIVEEGKFSNSEAIARNSQNKNLTCDYCGEKIKGRYWKYEKGLIVCKSCHERLPECAYCGLPMKKYYEVDSEKICKSCYNSASKCSVCNIPIKQWYVFGDKKICFDCCETLPKCELCGIPITGKYISYEGTKICLKCYAEVPKCTACEAPIMGLYWNYKGSKGEFCNKCETTREHCSVCGVPVGKKYWELSDGRIICEGCNSTAVTDIKEASRLLKKAIAFVESRLDMKVRHSSGLTLVDQDKLDGLSKNRQSAHRLLGLFKRVNDRFDIYLLYGLPEALTLGVLAHEYAHAWQAENCPDEQSLLIKEGFAEWVCYKTLRRYGYKKEAKQMERRTDLYGQGFKKIWRIEKKSGVKRVFKYVKENTY